MSRDIPHEARILVKRMHSDPKVNVTEQWKVSTATPGSPISKVKQTCRRAVIDVASRECFFVVVDINDNLYATCIAYEHS